MLKVYFTINQIKQANRSLGHNWFDSSNMRFFNCKVLPRVYSNNLFISSEKYHNDDRMYTVRQSQEDGSIETISEFNTLSLGEARKLVKALSKVELEGRKLSQYVKVMANNEQALLTNGHIDHLRTL